MTIKKKEAEIVRGEFNKKFNGGVVTKISKVSNYKKAEEYHQKYYQKKECCESCKHRLVRKKLK